ncbi:MAG: hypothetical protein ACI4MI_04070 [Christensenellales bacterium]
MQDIVIIKLYRNAIECCEFNDLTVDHHEELTQKLKDFGKTIGKKVVFTVCSALEIAEFDCFAEISYNGDITPKEKQYYIDILKEFSKDAEISDGVLSEYSLPLTIFFNKINLVDCC